jgi:hypothetical protein
MSFWLHKDAQQMMKVDVPALTTGVIVGLSHRVTIGDILFHVQNGSQPPAIFASKHRLRRRHQPGGALRHLKIYSAAMPGRVNAF